MGNLTIDEKRLGDLFLPAIQKDIQALEVLYAAMRRCKTSTSAHFQGLNWASVAMKAEHDRRVEIVRERGGLLLIGGVV